MSDYPTPTRRQVWDLLGREVEGLLTWDWPTGATDWRWLPDAGKEFVLAMPETIDLSEKIHLLEPAAAYPVFFSGEHDWPKP